MAQDRSGAGAAAGGITLVIPGEMAARVDRLPVSGMAWELALLVQVDWACSASADGISARLYPFIWLPRHVMTSFEYSVLYALETGISILIGGYAIGWLADRIGRRTALILSSVRGADRHIPRRGSFAAPGSAGARGATRTHPWRARIRAVLVNQALE